MPSEARRGAIRIASNYLRLVFVILLGLWLARIQFDAMGPVGFGLIALLGSTAGIASIIDAVMRRSMIRELGSAYHAEDPAEFRNVYNSALLIVCGAAVVTALLTMVLWSLLPYFNIPAEFFGAARWFVLFKGLEYCLRILLTPGYNMYIVTERMAAFNTLTTATRVAYVAAAGLALVLSSHDQPRALVLFGAFSAAARTLVVLIAIVLITFQYPGMVPRPRSASLATAAGILKMSGWNSLVIVANNLHIRLDAIFMNFWFGADFGNVVFGTGAILASYVRRATSGATDGIEAVATRMSTRSSEDDLRRLVHTQTRLHAFVSVPAAVLLGVLTEPVIKVWLGQRLAGDPALLPSAVVIARILIIGTAVRAIADAWVRIFYGTGDVKRFAWLCLAGGVANPIFAVALYMSGVLPEEWRYTAPACAYVLSYAVFALLVLPLPASRILKARYFDMLRPAIGSVVCAAAAAPILLMFAGVPEWTAIWLAAAGCAYGAIYTPLAFAFVLTREERARFIDFGRRLANPETRRRAIKGGGGRKRPEASQPGESPDD